MTWRERRIVTILSAILAILCAALLIVLGIRYRENRDIPETDTPAMSDDATEQTAYTALTYDNGTATLSFARDESGAWIWSDDPEFPLDDSTITAITDLLTAWNPQQTITDTDVIADSGLEEPAATLLATTSTGTISLAFGKTTTDGTSYYVRLNEDDTTVYIIDGGLYELMCTPIYDMCVLPVLPALQERIIQSIVITGAAAEDGTEGLSTVLTAQRAEGEDNVTSWRSSGANVTDAPSVRDLLEDLGTLSFTKCILYRPSDEAASICGFDNPAKLSVTYTSETGTDEALNLLIGSPLPDGSGRYVRLGKDSAIYSLPTASLDPLMPLSVTGLEG